MSASDEETSEKGGRRKITDVLGIRVAPSRVRTIMVQKIEEMYPDETAEIAALKEQKIKLKSENEAGENNDNDDKIKEITDQIKVVGQKIPRLSAAAPVILAGIVDFSMVELINSAYLVAKDDKKATIRHDHLLGPQIEDIITFPFWAPLMSYRSIDAEKTEESADESGEKTPTFATYITKIINHVKQELVEDLPEEEKEEEEEDEEGKKKSKGPFRVTRIFNSTCSSMVQEFVGVVTEQAYIMAVNVKKARTISAEHVVFACESMLTTYGRDHDSIKEFTEHVGKLTKEYAAYNVQKKAESEKAPEKELTEEEKKAKVEKELEKAKAQFLKALLKFGGFLQEHGLSLGVLSEIIKEQYGGGRGTKGKK